jgi:transcriptional regulator with XRE-family HTH domain
MTGAEIRSIRKRLGLTQQGFADRIGISRRTIEAWESSRRFPAGLYLKALESMMDNDGRFSLHLIQTDGEPAEWTIDRATSVYDARHAALADLAGRAPADAARGIVIRDAEQGGKIVARVRVDEWRIEDELIQGPGRRGDCRHLGTPRTGRKMNFSTPGGLIVFIIVVLVVVWAFGKLLR